MNARLRRKLYGWLALTGGLAALSYAAQAAAPAADGSEPLYQYTTAIGGAVQYAIMLGLALVIARGLSTRELFALRRPSSWGRAAGTAALGLAAIVVAGGVLGLFLDAGGEQGLVPSEWDSGRAGAFAANFVVVAVAAPVVEEMIYRGLGLSLVGALAPPAVAVAATALLFGLAHGLVVALPVLAAFGVVLAVVRLRTDSLYPAIALHAVFNGAALIAGVTLGL